VLEAHRLAACKKNAARLGAHLLFLDESGFLLIPPVRKTWSPRGQTPFHHHLYRHDRISAISGVSVSPKRRRLGLYCQLFDTNIDGEMVCGFLKDVLRHLRGHVVALLDNGTIHKGAPIHELLRRHPRLHLESFPPYAPELNPDEGVWTLLKQSLSNSRPDSAEELMDTLSCELRRIGATPSLLRFCVEHSELPFSLP
jgi:transposase